jgi:predicted Zn-dependent protease with MMP-like domain
MSSPDVEALWHDAWRLLDDSKPDAALALARRWLTKYPDLAEAHYVAGVAEADLDDPEASLDHHARAAILAPDWDEAVVMHVAALFRMARFSEAHEIVAALDEDPPEIALFHHLRGLLLERAGDDAGAREAFAAAEALDPEEYAPPCAQETAAFQATMEAALLRLPAEFRRALENMAIVLEPFPDEATLTDASPPHDPEILGLYVGTPLPMKSVEASGQTPDVIYLFQKNLERNARTRAELEEEIAVTLYHEVAHALGFEETDMPGLGLE